MLNKSDYISKYESHTCPVTDGIEPFMQIYAREIQFGRLMVITVKIV